MLNMYTIDFSDIDADIEVNLYEMFCGDDEYDVGSFDLFLVDKFPNLTFVISDNVFIEEIKYEHEEDLTSFLLKIS